jgi:preprotein translocase subunit SecA
VHIITVNDYLARRDSDEMRPIYEALGLSVACIIQGMSPSERQIAYDCDVVFCSNSELVFDYLKDQIEIKSTQHPLQLHAGRLRGQNNLTDNILLKGLHFAIVDEADSVFIDEARTPLIISASIEGNQEEIQVYKEAHYIASQAIKDIDFRVDLQKRYVTITDDGEDKIKLMSANLGAFWKGRVRRIELVSQALSSIFLFQKDIHYLVRDEKVQIIDEHTGRVMPDRSWEKGLHQFIEFKENCKLTPPRETLEKISYQRFFRFYHHLSGMTGTAYEVRSELWSTYQLPIIRIPTHKSNQRKKLGLQIFQSNVEKLEAIILSVQSKISDGRAILIGTDSVVSSEQLSNYMQLYKIDHQVLNAKQDDLEASIIAAAGQLKQVTISTSMAGRGTDIKLSNVVQSNGGLHVILTELNESSRIDRQLEGRCARMGDYGSTEIIVSMEDPIMKDHPPWLWRLFMNSSLPKKVKQQMCFAIMKYKQKILERRYSLMRAELLKSDQHQVELLAFAGNRL